MQAKDYKKVTNYEAKPGDIKKAILLYSGGLDTSIMLKWIKEQYNCELIALTLDIGQQKDDLDAVRKKALKLGADKAIVLDAKEDFANLVLAKAIKANASYQGDYHLSTPLGRVIISLKAVEVANAEGADAIAHGCTGKGNDQVRFDGYITTLNPKLKIIAPVREWDMDRNEQIDYAEANGIEVMAKRDFPYSVDDNMWGMTWEGGEIEDPAQISPIERFLTTYTIPENAPDQPELLKLTFDKGLPVTLNGKKMPLHELLMQLNKVAGVHGIGIVHMVEDRVVGVKNGGVYELPGAHTIIKAHKALEQYTSTRILNETKNTLDTRWGYLCYGAMWFDPLLDALNSFNDSVNEVVTGEVTLKLFKGKVDVVALASRFGLMHTSFNNNEGYNYNVNSSAAFIEIYTQQMKVAHNRQG